MEILKEREFKTTMEQWKVVVQYFEQYPILLKNRFHNVDGDSSEIKQKWQELTGHLNSMGLGARAVEKWQMAIGRWKSKTKAKACAVKLEREKTGGGPCKAPPLNDLEERLMAVLGWKAIIGDKNKELGVPSTSNIPRASTANFEISQSSSASSLPPLIQLKRQSEKETIPPKKKIKTTTEKTKRFVSLNKMHSENREILKNIEKNTEKMSNALLEISSNIKRYVDFMMPKNDQ